MAGRGGHEVYTIIGPSAHRARLRPLRRRLVVAAPTTASAVRSVGGWLFDSAVAGWDILVLVADGRDTRPLRILGARPGNLTAAMRSPVAGPPPHVLVVDNELHATDARVQRLTRLMLDNELTEVWLWGHGVASDGGSRRHRLSAATRAFKAHALAAAGVSVRSVDAVEVCRRMSFQDNAEMTSPNAAKVEV